MAFSHRIPRSVPRWLLLAHGRSQRVGLVRVMVEASMALGATVTVLMLAASPLLGWQPGPGHLVFGVLVASMLACAVLGSAVPAIHALAVARLRMRKVATHDARTGIVNRRHFTQLAYREWERCRRYRSGAAMLVVDADLLNTVEEEHGKAAGDAVMRAIALACDGLLRKPDLLGRYAGNSLVVFLPHTDTLGAIDVAERVRATIAQSRVPWPKHPLRVTVSVGVATLGDQHLSLNSLILDAEAALHTAQQAGRNCVRTSPSPPRHSGRAYPVMPH